MFFGDQAFVEVGLPIGEDFGLVLGHAGLGQALDEGVSVEGGLRLQLHERQNNGWVGGMQAGLEGRDGPGPLWAGVGGWGQKSTVKDMAKLLGPPV